MNKQDVQHSLAYHFFSSPLGWLLVAASDDGLCLIDFCGDQAPSRESCEVLLQQACPGTDAALSPRHPLLARAEEAIAAYLHHGRPLPPLPLDVRSGTPFQLEVWEVLRQIPFGETRSYVEVARAVQRPQAPRAVGQACGRNPLPLFIPCHRVIGANRGLGGYSGGLHIKRALLSLEQSGGSSS